MLRHIVSVVCICAIGVLLAGCYVSAQELYDDTGVELPFAAGPVICNITQPELKKAQPYKAELVMSLKGESVQYDITSFWKLQEGVPTPHEKFLVTMHKLTESVFVGATEWTERGGQTLILFRLGNRELELVQAGSEQLLSTATRNNIRTHNAGGEDARIVLAGTPKDQRAFLSDLARNLDSLTPYLTCHPT